MSAADLDFRKRGSLLCSPSVPQSVTTGNPRAKLDLVSEIIQNPHFAYFHSTIEMNKYFVQISPSCRTDAARVTE